MLFLVLYLCLVRGLRTGAQVSPALAGFDAAGWQGWLDPFMALRSVQSPTETWRAGFAPAYGFAGMMVLLSALLNGWGLLRLRVWNPSGEPIMQRERPEDIEAKDAELAKDEAKRAPPPTPRRARCARWAPTRSCGGRSPRAPTAGVRCW